MEHSLLANHERQFAMPLQREARTDRHTSGKQLWTRSSRRTSTPPNCAGTSWRLMPILASEQQRWCGCAVAHGRRAEPVLRAMLLETLAGRTSDRARTAPKHHSGSGRQWAQRRAPDCGPWWLNHHRHARLTGARTSLARRPPADGLSAWAVV